MKLSWILPTAALLATGCACYTPPTCDPEVDDCTDSGKLPPDVCNSKEEALTNKECELLVGAGDAGTKLSYIGIGADGGVDTDWYLIKLGALTPRSLIHVTAGYGVLSSPVNLSVSLLKEAPDGGVIPLVREIDKHGAGPPKPVDIVWPYPDSNTRVFVLLGDEMVAQKPVFDVRSPYALKAEVIENPDLNEPNDTVATNIVLMPGPNGQIGAATGVLATDDDIDLFSFVAPAGRKILYLHITGYCDTPTAAICATRLQPSPPSRLAYVLKDSLGVPVAEGQVKNEFIEVDLATARLTSMGKYTLSIFGYKLPNQTTVTPGDLRQIYRVEIQLMDDLDTNEPNDTLAAATRIALAYGTGTSRPGRLAYVPDPDIFALDLASSPAAAGVLRYSLTLNPAGGRFPPLALASDRQIRIITLVTTGADLTARTLACRYDSAICPKGYEGGPQQAQGLVEGLCSPAADAGTDPWCTWSERNEHPDFSNLKNMNGAIPIPPHTGVATYYMFVQDEGNNYADDRQYTINFTYEADPDDTARPPNAATQTTLVENASYPTPISTGEVSGVISHGYGRIITDDRIMRGIGVRAANDYDAVLDTDRFEMQLPGLTIPTDRSWALEWELFHNDAGSPPADLALEILFCTTATTSDGGCNAAVRPPLAYSPDTIEPWYSPAQMDRGVQWKKTVNANSTTFTAEPLGCFCFQPKYSATGHFMFRALAVDRNRNEPLFYKVRQHLAPYPPSFTMPSDGGMAFCPVATDGGGSCKMAP